MSTPTTPSSESSESSEIQPEEKKRFSLIPRIVTSGVLIVTAVAAIAYRLLGEGELEQTTALFIGLPLLIGLLTVNLTRVQSPVGAVIRVNIIFLCIVSPLLGEGSICILMAAPIFIGISVAGALIYQAVAKRTALALAVLIVPFTIGMLEKETSLFGPITEKVETTIIQEGNLEEWKTLVQQPIASLQAVDSTFLSLGFPLPSSYTEQGDQLLLQFHNGEKDMGAWKIQTVPTVDGVNFQVVEDTSKIGTWLSVTGSRVEITSLPKNQVKIKQSTEFVPILSPHWYFVPMQKYAIELSHEYASQTWGSNLIP